MMMRRCLFNQHFCDIMIKHIITAYNRVYFLQNKSLIIVHVFRGVKYCLNILHRRWIVLEFLINTGMFDVYHLSNCKPHVYYLYTTCTLPVNCRHRFKQKMMYSVQKSWAEYIIFGFTWSWLESTIYRTQDEHASHYNTNVVRKNLKSVYVVRGVKCWLNRHRLIIVIFYKWLLLLLFKPDGLYVWLIIKKHQTFMYLSGIQWWWDGAYLISI
jgi:hypothetical protein